MIVVERPKLDDPQFAVRTEKATRDLILRVQGSFESGRRRADHYDFRLRPEILRPVRKRLAEATHQKCAYCESPVGPTSQGELEDYRPKASVAEDPAHPGYYWLTYAWDNLLFTCSVCNRSKHNRFPISGARAQRPEHDLGLELPLLLDPCSGEDPAFHLVFQEDGMCAGLTERGKATIEILSLNRAALVHARRQEAQHLTAAIAAASGSLEQMREEFADWRPYAGMRRQVGLQLLRRLGLGTAFRELSTLPMHTLNEVEVAATEAKRGEERKRDFSVESTSELDRVTFQRGFKGIERIEIRNFKAIRSLDLKFPQSEDRSAWLMLLGENSTGKSSILRALALTMTGEDQANELGLSPESLVNFEAAEQGEPCEVTVHLTALDPIRLTFTTDSERFRIDPPKPKMLIAAYGPTRLLPAAARRNSSTQKYVRIKNLFDATAPLNDVERWLQGVSEDTFADFRESALVLLPELSDLGRAQGRVKAALGRRVLCLHDLSDGYQSLLALLGDIAITISDYWSSLKVAEGLVLIDEIETHLHPRWKISIVERLRAACPQMTFVVTSHDPLCLKGLEDDEIAVLRRSNSDAVVLERNTMSVTHLRWDQLLASFLFNLPSTRDSSTPALVARYSHLLGKATKTQEELDEFTKLQIEIKRQFSSAMTPMQRSVEAALAQTLRAEQLDPDQEDVRLEMRRQVAEVIDREDTL